MWFIAGCCWVLDQEVPHVTPQKAAKALGSGATCVAGIRPGQYKCTYTVTEWDCAQSGGFRTRCKPAGTEWDQWR